MERILIGGCRWWLELEKWSGKEMEKSGQREEEGQEKLFLLKLWRNVIHGPSGKIVDEDEAIHVVNFGIIGILTDKMFSRAL